MKQLQKHGYADQEKYLKRGLLGTSQFRTLKPSMEERELLNRERTGKDLMRQEEETQRTRVIHRFSPRCSKTRTCLCQCEGSGNTIRLRFQAGLIHHSCAGSCSSTPASGVSSCPPLGGAVSIHPAICSQVAKSMLSTSKIVIMEISIEPSLVRP